MTGRWDSLKVDDTEMRCYVTLPDDAGPAPGVTVCMHAPGVDQFICGIGDRLAEAGFASIAPDLYHRETEPEDNPLKRMAKLRDDPVLRDLDAATTHLRGLPEVRASHTGVIGFCMGGRLAFLYASQDPALRAAVVFYGGNILVPWGSGPSPFERSDRIGCPVLGLFGEDDANPSPEDVARIDAELTRLGKAHEFESYAGAGHAFLNEDRPSYRPEAAADAWQRCLSWLRRYLS
jgi:carboxymethylenebutenolidase